MSSCHQWSQGRELTSPRQFGSSPPELLPHTCCHGICSQVTTQDRYNKARMNMLIQHASRHEMCGGFESLGSSHNHQLRSLSTTLLCKKVLIPFICQRRKKSHSCTSGVSSTYMNSQQATIAYRIDPDKLGMLSNSCASFTATTKFPRHSET